MPGKQITINEAYIKERINQFANLEKESLDRSGAFDWSPSGYDLRSVQIRANISQKLPLSPGAADFQPAVDLASGVENVRSNFATRVTQFHEQAAFLRSGLQAVLDNSQKIEDLNTVSAADFGNYVSEAPSADGPSGGSASPSPAGA